MSDTIIAAIIGAVGSILAAIIGQIIAVTLKKDKNKQPRSGTASLFLVIPIALLVGLIIGFIAKSLLQSATSTPSINQTEYVRMYQEDNPSWLIDMVKAVGLPNGPAVAIKPPVASNSRGETHYLSIEGKRFTILFRFERDSQENGYAVCPKANWRKYTDSKGRVWQIAHCNLEHLQVAE